MPRTTSAATSPPVSQSDSDGANDDQMECGVAELASSLIATVNGTIDEPLVAAPEIGRGFYSGSIRVTTVGWQSTSAEHLAIAQVTGPIMPGESYPVIVFGDDTTIALFESLVDAASRNSNSVIVLGLSGVGAQIPGLRLYGTVSGDAFASPSGCDDLRTAQLHNIAAFTGSPSLAAALAVLADEVQLHTSGRPGPIERSASGLAEDTPTT